MTKENTKRQRILKKRGFMLFDLLFSLLVTTIFLSTFCILISFMASQFSLSKQYSNAEIILHSTIYDLETDTFYNTKIIEQENTNFVITNTKEYVSHTPLTTGTSKMPIITTKISWVTSKGTEEKIIVKKIYSQLFTLANTEKNF